MTNLTFVTKYLHVDVEYNTALPVELNTGF